MKTLLTIIFCSTGILCFSQLQPFTDPDFGRFEPKFQHQGYLIGNNYTEGGEFNGIYKLNLSNGETTLFTSDYETGPMAQGYDPRQAYGNDIYLGQPFVRMSVDEAHIYPTDIFYNEYGELGATLSGTIFGNRVYWYSTFWSRTFYYDLDTNQIINYSGSDDYGYPAGPILFDIMVLGNMAIAKGKTPPYGEFWQSEPNSILKMDSSHTIEDSSLITLDDGYFSSFVYSFGHVSHGKIHVNGRELFPALVNNSVGDHVLSVDPNNISASAIISDGFDSWNNMDYIILPDGIIFSYRDTAPPHNITYYKTNGSSFLEEINEFDDFVNFENFRSASPYNWFSPDLIGNAFIQIGDVTYFNTRNNDQLEGIYKMSSINGTPELVFSSTPGEFGYHYIRHATEWNGNLLFVLQDNDSTTPDVIYLYDGSELIANPDLNAYSDGEPRPMGGTTEAQPTVNGLFSYGDLLLVHTNVGVYSIEYDEVMSVQDKVVNNLQIYPNPAKDELYFSEKVNEISVYDLSGKVVKRQKDITEKLNIIDLSNGIYVIKGTTEDGLKFNSKFIKN